MKTIKLKIDQSDLSNPAVTAALNTLFLALGGQTKVTETDVKVEVNKVEELVKAPRTSKKIKEVDTDLKKFGPVVEEIQPAVEEAEPIAEDAENDFTEANESAAPSSSITLPKVREALGLKVNENREVIKAKLTELGAKNVSTLSPEHYEAMYEFLTGL